MDVHQMALLARQPSARVTERATFLGMPKRLLAVLLVNVMFWQPLWAQADGIAVSGTTNTQVGKAGNGVPVINIAAPNGAGLSHNQFKQYNVDRNGVILNNSTQAIQATQLGGNILGNDQLKGRAANTILNEVTGANATQLRGYTEVAGQSARVIVANPDGISCNGCGFINTPRVTLSTGKPELNASGKLERFAVDGGSVSIDGQGLDASRVDQFDIITRSAKINADIHAKQLNVIAGANDVDADTLATRARTGNPADKPQLAIDSSALGGMYADTIKLVGTERGVGVKTAGNLAASAGDIQLDANGHLNMAQASAKGTLDIKAASVELTGKAYAGNARVRTPGELSNAQSLATRDSIDISAGSVRNAGTLAAGVNTDNTRNAKGDLRIDAAQVSNSGSLEASRRLSVKASEAVDNRAVMQAKTVELSTAQLTNQGKNARIVGEQALVLATPAIVNLEGVIRFGNGQDVSLQLDRLENRNGLIQTGNASLAIKAKAVDNQAGQIDASRLSLDTDTLDNRAGLLSARSGNAQINARSSLDNSAGTVQAQQRLSIDAGELINQNGRLLAIAGDLRLSASSLDNRAGRLLGAAVDIAAPGARIDNRGGKIVAERIDLRAAALDNREQGLLAAGAQGLALMLASQSNDASQPHLLNRGGQLQSEGALALSGAWLDNSGGTVVGKQLLVDAARLHNDDKGALVSDGGDIRLNVGTTLSNLGGVLDAGNGALVLRGGAAVDNQAGSLRGKQLDLAVSSLDNSQQGQLVAGSGGLNYSGNLLDNDQGSVLARGGQVRLDMAGGSVSNLGGAIQGDSVLIDAARLSNGRLADDTGSIASLAGDLTLNVGNLSNSGGQLFARYALAFQGDRLSNTGGAQLSGEGVRIAAGQLDNQGGLIEANSSLTLSGATLDNRGGQLRALGNPSGAAKSASASDLSSLDFSERIDNSNGRIAVGSSALRLKADALDNRDGSLEHAGAGLLTLDFKRLNGAGGSINALGSGDWQFGSVDGLGKVQLNKALTYTSDALALQAGDRLASGSDLTLNLRQLDNAGDLLSDGNLQLNLSGDLSNSGRLSAQRLIAIKANQLTQNGGRIGAGSDLRLELAGNLDNLGFLTARNTLSIDAARIDNRGTLGAQGAAILSASQSINNGADALLFSGGGMALRSAAVNNLYGDLYSVGDLSVAGLDGAPAQRFSNLSGTVESQGAISLNAAFVENAKAEFELGQTVVSGSLSWVCGQHCKGHDSFKRGEITIEQTLLETAVKDSPSARLVAGKDLTINADQVQNRYSLLAANGNLGITANDLLNLGASERTGHEITVIGTPGRIDTGYWDQMEYIDVPAFNAAVAAGNFDLARFELLKSRSADSRFAELSHDLPWTDKSPPLYAATLQAGGTVNLNVARSVQNGAVSEHNVLEILTGALGDDQTSAPLGVLELTLNKQAEGANSVGIGSVTPVKRVDADGSVQTGFTPVDYSGIPFVSVDPTQGATFQLPKGEYGLFIRNPDPTSNYLIETNPKLTDLSQFLGSDYLLDRLKIDPDNNWRRLGDGLYEQRLIRDAVLAQTGQRFLANGLASDYDQYRYLMDNAVASKDALNLSLGVSLNAEQVGALTHDIVWMENRVVEGQKVLVPVLYLAKADARNVRGNSLIQGRDLNLISGGDLINVGTLRASNDLNVASGGSIYQGGLVEAGNNLQMLAQDSIRNAMAGEIRGERVSLTAVKGDILNERTAIKVRDGVGYKTFTDVGSGISAGKDLTVSAGRDITNYGSVRAGNTATLQAGGDVNLLAKTDESQKRQLLEGGHRTITKTQARQLSSSVAAGSDLNTAANRDINVVASRASAGKDLALDAGRDVNIASAQNEDAYSAFKKSSGSFGRKKTHQEETYDATNVASKIEAGQDLTINTRKAADGGVSLSGGRDVNIVGSQLSAGNDLILGATSDVSINAAAEQHGTYSKTTKSGSFGLSKSGKSQMTSNVAQVGSELSAGNDAVIATGRDVNLRGSSIEAGRDADLRAGLLDKSGDINLLSANQEAFSHQEKYKKKTGLSLSGGFLSIASAKEAGNQAQDVTSVGSQIDAMRNAYLRSERDINVVGSRIDAGDDIGLQAGRDVNVLAAQNSHSSQDWKSKKQTGIGISSDDNGVTLFAGNERNKAKDRLAQETSAASQISAGGNLDVAARRDINQVGSDLQAFNDIRLAAGRDVNIDAARESQVTEQMRERSRNGLSATINHNFGNTKDAVSGAGKGEDATSKASSTLRAVDSISQFLSGPTADAKFGNSRESSRQIVTETSNRPSTLDAGNDLNIAANNAVRISGGQLQSGRDINIQGRDVTLDAAKGSYAQESSEQKSWSGIHGGTSGGFKIGVGGSRGVADNDQSQGNSTVTALQAGRDANLKASNDLNLIGTQIQTQRDINLGAGNTLNITAAQNDSETNNSRRSGGGEVGLAIGSEGVGFYASVNMGKGNLEREGEQQQEAYLYAGNQLAFTSGQDTNIGGATLRGKDVVGRVGRDLNVSSLPDTGKVQGKEFDLSATVVVGPGSGASGSVGYGKTTGDKNWVEKQTSITAQDKLDLRTGNHTQLDGALIASDTGNLKLDTNTLGFSDIAGKDKEHGYYLNVGGSYGIGKDTTQDPSQVGKGDNQKDGWSVEGWNYNKDRQQIVRGTVGAGEVVVRADRDGQDSTTGLNRDVDRAYEVTKDDERRTDLYVTKSSTEAALSPVETRDRWQKSAALYGENTRNATENLKDLIDAGWLLPLGAAVGLRYDLVENRVRDTELAQQLRSQDDGKRAVGIRTALERMAGGKLGSSGEALVTRLTALGASDPEETRRTLDLIDSLKTPNYVSNFAPVVPLAGGVALALSAALATPESQDKLREAANAVATATAKAGQSAKEQVSTSVEIWKYLFGTAFPVHLLDGDNSKLANPIAEAQGKNPSSEGYAAGGRPESSGSTGGREIVDGTGGDYSRPVEVLPAPGVMNQDSVDGEDGPKGEVSGLLPKPGATSIPASGVGAGAAFKVNSKQLGKKLGKHVEDFGGNAANPADRKMVLDKIHDVGSNPEKVIPGTFAGQGANGARGDVFFRVKGNDVVVTKPDGTFVTILKDGVTQNPSVQSALKGGVR